MQNAIAGTMSITSDQNQNIRHIKSQSFSTLRSTVEAMEKILYEPIPLLDHGFIRVIDYMGDDAAIVQAARVSYGTGTKKASEDRSLINYLMNHWHTTPFEMCEIKLHVKMPIFVARQWIRHRTANVNEYSARYSILDKEFYIPSEEHLAIQSSTNRQGRDDVLTGHEAARVLALLKQDSEMCYQHYMEMLNINDATGEELDPSKNGLTRELARMNLTLNYYTQWYWKIDLNNLLHFIRLRADDHAQYEIRVYAQALLEIIRAWVPATYEAFLDYRMHSVQLSSKAVAVIQKRLAGTSMSQEESGLSKREWKELVSVFGE